MNVSLTPELERVVNEKVESGMYQTASEVVREALRLLKERDDWTRRTNEMRDQVVCLLQSRHAYVKAGELGLKVLIPPP